MNFISTIITLFLITILAFSYNCVCDFFSWVVEKHISHHDKKWLMQSVSLFGLSFNKFEVHDGGEAWQQVSGRMAVEICCDMTPKHFLKLS